jgi:hypothetical protein
MPDRTGEGASRQMSVSARHICQRKPYLKTRVTGFRIDLNIAPVFLDNTLDSIESKPCALTDPLGSEKRLEDV